MALGPAQRVKSPPGMYFWKGRFGVGLCRIGASRGGEQFAVTPGDTAAYGGRHRQGGAEAFDNSVQVVSEH